MTGPVAFTSNYVDQSTREGYQFEFSCLRCGNGYASAFQHSVTGFGGRLLQMGGDLIGGPVGGKASEFGFDAQWMRDGIRGSTRDKALAKAAAEVQHRFEQCHRCGQWVCKDVCWNAGRGLCASCAPKLDQEVAGLQAAAQVDQLNEKIQQADWTRTVDHRDRHAVRCPACDGDTGGGKFCQHCGTPLVDRACGRCGTTMAPQASFCTECGQVAT